VTLDLDGWDVVRARDVEGGAVREVALSRSPAAGPPIRVAVDRKALARSLALGCHTLRLAGDGKPLVAEGDDKTFVAVCLDAGLAVPPDPDAVRVVTDERAGPTPRPQATERSTSVKTHETNGHPPGERHDPPAEVPDPLTEAEALRAALAEVVTRAGRLVAALKQSRRQSKALASVVTTLRQLNLGS
jgi:hypothetical protein